MKKHSLLLFLLVSFLYPALSQRRDVKALTSEKRQELAEKLIHQGGYYAAIDHMKDLVDKHPDNQTYIFKLAEAYFYSRDYKNAEKWYGKLVETKDHKKKKKAAQQLTIATFHYGESLKYNAKYDQAREVFDIFANSNYRDKKGENYRNWAKAEVLSCEFALNNKDRIKYVEIANLDSNINASYSDFAPRMQDDTTLVYSSIQEDSVISIRHGDKHFEHTKLYTATLKDSAWQASEELKGVNSAFEHSANGTFSTLGKRFYFTRCRPVNGKMKCQIYVSQVTQEGLASSHKLAGAVNHAAHSSTQPFAVDVKVGKNTQQMLFFSSDLKGGAGGMDIWYSIIDKNGRSGKPVNCGKVVNTSRDEVTPFYDTETNTLYFSSNGLNGFGGFDVFKAAGTQNKFAKPENMFKPVNSNLDDTYYTFAKNDRYKGFVVSNRPGGFALLSETCCDDIYSFRYRQPTILVVTVTDSATGKVVPNSQLTLKSTRYASNLPDSILFETAEEVMDTLPLQSDKSYLENLHLLENPAAFYVLETNNVIQVASQAKGYTNSRAVIKTNKEGIIDSLQTKEGKFNKTGNTRFVTLNVVMGKEKPQVIAPKPLPVDTSHLASTLKKEFEKVKEPIVVKERIKEVKVIDTVVTPKTVQPQKVVSVEFALNLHFQYDKAEIVEWDQTELDSLVTILKNNQKIKMEFTTHTDQIGSDDYNLKLSFRRAAFINNYIVSKGISQKRIKGKGLGETKHLSPNVKPDGSDFPEGRQLNRRTDIKLITGS